jgi:anti-anti-sigma regulatory factor
MAEFRLNDAPQGSVLVVGGALTAEYGDAARTAFMEAIEGRDNVSLDLSKVTALDAAGFQIVWSALRTAGLTGRVAVAFQSLPEDLKKALRDWGYDLRERSGCPSQRNDTACREEG